MPRRSFVYVVLILFLATLEASFFVALHIPYAFGSAKIWTDKPDYTRDETVTVFGTGFKPNTNIMLAITRPDLVVETFSTTSSSSGNFIYHYILDGIFGTYIVTATDGTNTARTTFTDSDHVDWVQGHDDTAPHDGTIDMPMVTWHTGAMNAQNSILTEGNIVPPYPPNVPGHVNYRAIIEDKDFGSGTYALMIQYEFTKGGEVAFDFLTTNYGITDSNLQTQLPVWADSLKISSLVTAGPSTATFQADVFPLPLSLGLGTVQDRQGAHDTVFTLLNPRKMKLYGATITGITQGSHSGSATGDSDATVTITFTKSTDWTWPIVATWAGHLGIGVAHPVGYGVGKGAGSVSGAPFHMSLGSLVNLGTGKTVISGKRDLSVQMGAIAPSPGTGNIVVEKITLGGMDTFNFVGAGTVLPPGFGSFSITTVTSGVAESTGFTNVNVGTYTVTEQALAGWDLTSITIIDPDGGSSHTGSVATLDVDSGETVTVTFINTERGVIIVHKTTYPDGDPASFEFTSTDFATFYLSDDESETKSNLVPGTYDFTESALTEWDLTALTSDDAETAISGALATVDLDAGETVNVYYENTKRGKIVVDKITVPAADPQSFSFAAGGPDSYSASFSLTDAATPWNSGWIKPGTGYAVTETVPGGWDLTSVTVNGVASSNGASLALNPGQILYVNFTDTKCGNIIVHKTTVPASDPADFTFDPDYQVSNFVLSDGEQYNSGAVVPGTYHVQESALAGWDLTGLTVIDPSGGSSTNLGTGTATIGLAAGETVDVYYTNTKHSKVTIIKDAIPNDAEDFSYTGGFGAFTLDDDADPTYSSTKIILNVASGSYNVIEGVETWWDLTSIGISGDDDYTTGNTGTRTATIYVDPGEDITIAFTNKGYAKVTVVKDAIPDNAQDFSFSGGLGSFILDDDADATYSNTEVFSKVYAGSYAVTESVPSGWNLDSITVVGDPGHSVIKPSATLDVDPGEDITVTFVNKIAPVTCTVTFYTSPSAVGSISFMSGTYTNGQSQTYAYGTSGLATANVPTGYVFDHWEVTSNVQVSSTTTNPTTVTITCGGTLKAVFSQIQCSVTFYSNPTCGTITFQGGTYMHGASGTFPYGTSGSAIPNAPAGYVFDHWETTGNVQVSGNTVTVTCGGTVKAVFKQVPVGPPVGGEWISIDNARLLVPWVSSTLLMAVTIVSFVCVRRVRRRNT